MEDGFEILKLFHKKLLKLSLEDTKKIEKLVKDKGGTFKGAAWSMYQNKRYSPHKANIDPKLSTTTKIKPNEKKPYAKEIRPGIRTIMFK